jgi:hypothetical protein
MNKNNIKKALKVHDLLHLYGLTIQRNLDQLKYDRKKFDATEPEVMRNLSVSDQVLKQITKDVAEVLETIFLKTRHVLSQLDLDTIAEERLESLGVNFPEPEIYAPTIAQLKSDMIDKYGEAEVSALFSEKEELLTMIPTDEVKTLAEVLKNEWNNSVADVNFIDDDEPQEVN